MSMFCTMRVDLRARRDQAGGVGQQRHADRHLEGVSLVVEAVLAQRKSVVAHVQDQRVAAEAGFVQVLQDAAQVLVQAVQRLAVAVVQLVEIGHGVLVERPGLHVVDAVDAVAAFPDPARLGLVVALRVGHRFRIIDRLFVVAALVPRGGLEGMMHGLVGQVQEERLGGVPFALQPLRGLGRSGRRPCSRRSSRGGR